MIEALKQLGGSASIEEIDEKVAEVLSLPDAARSEPFNEGPRTKPCLPMRMDPKLAQTRRTRDEQ